MRLSIIFERLLLAIVVYSVVFPHVGGEEFPFAAFATLLKGFPRMGGYPSRIAIVAFEGPKRFGCLEEAFILYPSAGTALVRGNCRGFDKQAHEKIIIDDLALPFKARSLICNFIHSCETNACCLVFECCRLFWILKILAFKHYGFEPLCEMVSNNCLLGPKLLYLIFSTSLKLTHDSLIH